MTTNTCEKKLCLRKNVLGKLLKHAFKRIWKEAVLLYSIIVFSFLILALFTRFAGADFINGSTIGSIIYALMIMFAVFSLCACAIYALIILFKSTTKNMFSDEGYLTFTLPVSVDELLFSKLIINLSFCVCGFLVSALSVGMFLFLAFDVLKVINELFIGIFSYIDGKVVLMLLSYTLTFILDASLEILVLILAMSFVHSKYKGKNKSTVGFFMFVGIRYAFNAIMQVLITLFSFGFGYDINGNFIFGFGFRDSKIVGYSFNFSQILLYSIATILIYILTRRMLNNKLELIGNE